jgi:dolichol-phosphate mannosyltransferase
MGPANIKEFTNSARAFTPELFKKIDFSKIPWREQTFIYMPAFVNGAVSAGAKYIEVPLIFKDRAEGYSKNKTINYMYDMLMYVIETRLHKLGIKIPFFMMTHKAKIIIKFGMVGLTGTIIDFTIYNLLIKYKGFPPATSKLFSAEIAIVNNFLLNNYWTFKGRAASANLFKRFGIFNLVSCGGIGISVGVIKILHVLYGDGIAPVLGLHVQFYNLYFLATIPLALVWNFTANNLITWRNKK